MQSSSFWRGLHSLYGFWGNLWQYLVWLKKFWEFSLHRHKKNFFNIPNIEAISLHTPIKISSLLCTGCKEQTTKQSQWYNEIMTATTHYEKFSSKWIVLMKGISFKLEHFERNSFQNALWKFHIMCWGLYSVCTLFVNSVIFVKNCLFEKKMIFFALSNRL